MNPRRLYRSRDRMLAGVAGGMAEYLNIDPTVSRVLWILAAILTGGLVLLAYIVFAVITPESPYAAGFAAPPTGWSTPQAGWSTPQAGQTWSPDWAAGAAGAPGGTQVGQSSRGRGFGAAAVVGTVLIVIGAIALADAALPGWSSAVILGPAVILALGAALLVASLRRTGEPVVATAAPATPGWSGVPATPATPATSAARATQSTAQEAEPMPTADTTDTQPVGPTAFG